MRPRASSSFVRAHNCPLTITMKLLGASFILCSVLSVSRAGPINSTRRIQLGGVCDYKQQQCFNLIGAFCPQCDHYGNFLPEQCSGSTGYCWCVDVITGDEIPNTRVRPGVVPLNCEKKTYCPYEWSQFGHRCFIFIDTPKTWAEAEFYCQFDRANLASVHSYEENHFVQSLTRGATHNFPETWLGGSDAIHNNFWMWSDGTKFYYQNWADEDNDGREEKTDHCLKMNYQYDLKWNPAPCYTTLPFICSKDI